MKRISLFLLFVLLAGLQKIPLSWAEPQTQNLTLADCYALALKRSEQIAIRQELITEAEGRFSQALSGILPRVSFSSSDKRQDGSGDSQFTLRKVPERKFVFTQPLFAGFKEFSAMAAEKAEGRQRVLEKKRAEQLLFLNVSDAYYLLLEKREDLRILQSVQKTLSGRLQELQQRERVGRSRTSEVVGTEAEILRTEAEEELVRGEETVSRQLLEFLIGRDLSEALEEPKPSLPHMDSDQTYLAKSPQRPDVQASKEAALAAEKQVAVAKAGYLPTVNAEGNYYVERVGASKDVTWDVALKVAVPLFSGGQTKGAVKEASSQAAQAALRASEAGRTATREVKEAYAKLQSALARSNALARALEASEESYRLLAEEYRRSLINNLEVLRSLSDLEDAHREFVHSQYDTQRSYWNLKVSAGDLP